MSRDLEPARARESLGALGKLLYDVEGKSLWQRDTEILSPRLRKLRRRYRRFAEQQLAPRELEADRSVDYQRLLPLLVAAASEGLLTEQLPRPWGSGQLRSLGKGVLWPAVLKAEELAAGDAGLGLGLLAHDLGTAPLMLSGQRRAIGWLRHIYRQLAAGEPAMAAFAITEPGAGSDVEDTTGAAGAHIVTRAHRAGGGWRLSGHKCFITGGRLARWVTVFAAIEDGGVDSWTCFLLDRSMRGLAAGRSERKMGQRAADATELLLDDVFVPDDRVVGEVGSGWALNRNVLNFSRPAVGAIALGIARSAFEHALACARSTRLGGRPLVEQQQVQLALSEMLTKIQAARALVWHTARYGVPFQAAGALPKAFCARVAWEVSTAAMELLGDEATLQARGIEKAARDARLTLIYEGTEQINLLAIAEGQSGELGIRGS